MKPGILIAVGALMLGVGCFILGRASVHCPEPPDTRAAQDSLQRQLDSNTAQYVLITDSLSVLNEVMDSMRVAHQKPYVIRVENVERGLRLLSVDSLAGILLHPVD